MSKILTIKTTVILFSCIGAVLVIISTHNYGTGLSPDSVEYFAAADNLLLSRGLLSYNGLPITEWPPLYPVILALCSYSLGISIALSAVVLNAVLFGLIIYKTGMILKNYLSSKTLIIVGLLSVLFSIPVFAESLWAHSELLFIFFLILYIDFLLSYVEKGRLIYFILIVILTALAMLTRYVGIILIFITIITILFYSNENLKKKIISIFVYSALSSIPIGIWLIRNYLISNTFFGERGASRFSFFSNIDLTIEKILSWDISYHLINLKIFFIIFFLITVALLCAILLKKIKFKDIYLKFDKRITVILSLFISVYLLFLIIVSSIKAHNSIDSRLLSPVFIPVLILLLIILQAVYIRIKSFKNFILLNIVFLSLFVLGSIKPVSYSIKIINYHYYNGAGYSGSLWQKGNKKKWLTEMKKIYIKNSAIYSNEPFEIYYLINNYAKWSPRKTFYDSDEIYIRLIDLKGIFPDEKSAYLIWFNNIEFHTTSLYSPIELAEVSGLEVIDSSEIGTLYLIKRNNK